MSNVLTITNLLHANAFNKLSKDNFSKAATKASLKNLELDYNKNAINRLQSNLTMIKSKIVKALISYDKAETKAKSKSPIESVIKYCDGYMAFVKSIAGNKSNSDSHFAFKSVSALKIQAEDRLSAMSLSLNKNSVFKSVEPKGRVAELRKEASVIAAPTVFSFSR